MRHTAGLALALFMAGPALAQDAAPKVTFTMRTFDTVTVHAPPPWVNATDTDEIVGQSEESRQQGPAPNGGEIFIMEWIPAGESFDAWSELFAVLAETEKDGPVEGYRNGMINRFVNACHDASFQVIHEADDQQIFVTFCPAYVDTPDQGEIAAINLIKRGTTLVRNYYHKRGTAFSSEDESSWPLSLDELQAVLNGLYRFQLKAID